MRAQSRGRWLIFLLVLGGCSDVSDPPLTPASKEPATISIQTDTASFRIGESRRLMAFALTATGDTVSGLSFQWSSSDTTVAKVTADGMVTAVSSGVVSISAVVGSVSATVRLNVRPDPIPPRVLCPDGGGTGHAGTITTETWRAADGPHCLNATVVVTGIHSVLTIEPGTMVRAVGGAQLKIDANPRAPEGPGAVMVARGTALQPILFIAFEPAAPWGGIDITGFGSSTTISELTHVRIEDATSGVLAFNPVSIDNAVIRRISGQAVWLNADGRLANSLIEDSGTAQLAAVMLDAGVFEETIVRRARGTGVRIGRFSGRVSLLGGRIEESAGVGLAMDYKATGSLERVRPVRIVGSGAYPAYVSFSAFQMLWPTVADQQANLLGNARDMVSIYPAITGEVVIRRDLAWEVDGAVISTGFTIPSGARLRLEPGASLSSPATPIWVRGTITAAGTTEAPVTIGAQLILLGAPADTSRLTNMKLNDANARLPGAIVTIERHAAMLDRITTAPGATIGLFAPGSALLNSTIEAPTSAFITSIPVRAGITLGGAGVRLERTTIRNADGDGILIDSAGVRVSECEVTGSSRDGIRANQAVGVQVQSCNLERNVGFGVNNLNAAPLDARLNWWGDPVGPEGPNGDGVAGNVEWRPHRSTTFPITQTSASSPNPRFLYRRDPRDLRPSASPFILRANFQ